MTMWAGGEGAHTARTVAARILSMGATVPPGYSRTTFSGVPVTHFGAPVYDNGVTLFVLRS